MAIKFGGGKIRIIVDGVGTGMADIVRHPPEACGPVQPECADIQGQAFFPDLQPVTEDIRAIRSMPQA
jgi:hypothetical protein